MVEFKFIQYGTDFGTRDMGQKLRQKLLPLIKENDKVVLDFTGANIPKFQEAVERAKKGE